MTLLYHTLAPSERPTIFCQANENNESLSNCYVIPIELENWHGVQHGYQIFWISADELTQDDINADTFHIISERLDMLYFYKNSCL